MYRGWFNAGRHRAPGKARESAALRDPAGAAPGRLRDFRNTGCVSYSLRPIPGYCESLTGKEESDSGRQLIFVQDAAGGFFQGAVRAKRRQLTSRPVLRFCDYGHAVVKMAFDRSPP